MKSIYKIWTFLFCLSFISCYEDDKIIPTEDPLALAGSLAFPQGNNEWDQEAMDIYNKYGVKIFYKDITPDVLGKSWTGSGALGNGSILVESSLNDKMTAFYFSFLKKHIFPYINEEITKRVLPMYWYMVYDYCSYTSMEYESTKMETYSPKTKQDNGKKDCWVTCFWGSDDHNCMKMNGITVLPQNTKGWRSPQEGDQNSYKIRRLFILYDIINGAINKRNIPFPEKEFCTGFDFDKDINTKDETDENYFLKRGFPGYINMTSTEYWQYDNTNCDRNPFNTFIRYVNIAMKFTKAEREEKWPAATYPFLASKFDFVVNYLKKYGVDLEAISQGPDDWEIKEYPELPQPETEGNSEGSGQSE